MKHTLKLTAVIQEVPEGGFIAFIEEIPGANTQGETVEEAKNNLFDALTLLLDYQREKTEKSIKGKKGKYLREEFEFATL